MYMYTYEGNVIPTEPGLGLQATDKINHRFCQVKDQHQH